VKIGLERRPLKGALAFVIEEGDRQLLINEEFETPFKVREKVS